MKNRILTGFAAFLPAAALCFQTALPARAAEVRPDDTATAENILEVLLPVPARYRHLTRFG